MVVACAALAAIAGALLLSVRLGQPRVRYGAPGQTVSVGPLSLSVQDASWVGHDMSSMGPMPMEDGPAPGNVRLRAQVLVGNRTATSVAVDARDFEVIAGSGNSWVPQRATLPPTTDLPPDGSILGDLYFEVPEGETDFELSLARGGERAIVPLAVSGSVTHDDQHAEGRK